MMPKASSIFSGKFELDKGGFKSTENIGRFEPIAAKKKSNPFEWKNSEKNPTNNMMDYLNNSNSTVNQEKMIGLSNDLFLILNDFNNLKHRNKSSCQFEGVEQFDNITKLYINSTTNNCFCQTIYYIFNTISTDTSLLFKQLSPMLLGKILYSPKSPAYNRLIKRANATFENMDIILKYFGSLADIGRFTLNSLEDIMQGSNYLSENTKSFLEGLESNRTIDIDKALLQIKVIIEQLDFFRNLGFCIELNKFIGLDNETEAVKMGSALLENSNLWGAFIFKNPETQDKQLPDILAYKIRQNASFTHNTA
jgi:hypothetical protein